MAVKPRRMWRCSILHAGQVFQTVTQRNNGQATRHGQARTAVQSSCVGKWSLRAAVRAAAFSSESFTFTYQNIRCHTPQPSNIQTRHCYRCAASSRRVYLTTLSASRLHSLDGKINKIMTIERAMVDSRQLARRN